MTFNATEAIIRLRRFAQERSIGKCAAFVRQAIFAGGVTSETWPDAAKGYNAYLPSLGFAPVDPDGYIPAPGDIVVHQPPDGTGAGHVAMFDGSAWISDFRQRDIYGGPAFRASGLPYRLWRWPVEET